MQDLESNYMQRQESLVKQAATLKQLAEQFHLGVIVTNQVTTYLSRDGMFGSYETSSATSSDGGALMHSATGEQLSPALGTAWSHAVNTRLALDYGDTQWIEKVAKLTDDDDGINSKHSYRRLTVAKSPVAPNISLGYYVSGAGIRGVHNL